MNSKVRDMDGHPWVYQTRYCVHFQNVVVQMLNAIQLYLHDFTTMDLSLSPIGINHIQALWYICSKKLAIVPPPVLV
jgi:hypothetical protein